MSNPDFLENKKNIIHLSSAELAKGVVTVKVVFSVSLIERTVIPLPVAAGGFYFVEFLKPTLVLLNSDTFYTLLLQTV